MEDGELHKPTNTAFALDLVALENDSSLELTAGIAREKVCVLLHYKSKHHPKVDVFLGFSRLRGDVFPLSGIALAPSLARP